MEDTKVEKEYEVTYTYNYDKGTYDIKFSNPYQDKYKYILKYSNQYKNEISKIITKSTTYSGMYPNNYTVEVTGNTSSCSDVLSGVD